METIEKFIWFNSKKYTRDDKTGYFLNSTNRERLHRAVYKFFYGTIKNDNDIHHKDHNKNNNNIGNLKSILKTDHMSLHSKIYYKENKEKCDKHLDSIRDMTKEWHASEKGKQWHSEHGKECFKNKEYIDFKCIVCDTTFKSKMTFAKFCSNNCKSHHRRITGVDNVKRICEYCNEEFTVNKYSSAKTCSRSCTNRMRKSG